MKWNDPGRDAYLQMRERATQNERAFQGQNRSQGAQALARPPLWRPEGQGDGQDDGRHHRRDHRPHRSRRHHRHRVVTGLTKRVPPWGALCWQTSAFAQCGGGVFACRFARGGTPRTPASHGGNCHGYFFRARLRGRHCPRSASIPLPSALCRLKRPAPRKGAFACALRAAALTALRGRAMMIQTERGGGEGNAQSARRRATGQLPVLSSLGEPAPAG